MLWSSGWLPSQGLHKIALTGSGSSIPPALMGLSGSPAPTQRHKGGRGHVKGYLGKWKGELGSSLIKLCYTQLETVKESINDFFLKQDNKSKKYWTLTSGLYRHRNGPPHHKWVLDIIHNSFIFCSHQATSQSVSPLIHLTPQVPDHPTASFSPIVFLYYSWGPDFDITPPLPLGCLL